MEELIALGADADVKLSQQHMGKWREGEDAPCYLGAERSAKFNFWRLKMGFFSFQRNAPEATQDSIYGLIHIAVRDTAHMILLSSGIASDQEMDVLQERLQHSTTVP